MSNAFLFSVLLACSANSAIYPEPEAAWANTLESSSQSAALKMSVSPRRAPGPDHGDDPNDEQRQDLPNGGPDTKHYGDGYPSKDPYDDSVRNSQKPY